MPFLSLVTLTFCLDLETRPSEGPNTSSMWIWRKSVSARVVPEIFHTQLEMWANAQRDGRPTEYRPRWRFYLVLSTVDAALGFMWIVFPRLIFVSFDTISRRCRFRRDEMERHSYWECYVVRDSMLISRFPCITCLSSFSLMASVAEMLFSSVSIKCVLCSNLITVEYLLFSSATIPFVG